MYTYRCFGQLLRFPKKVEAQYSTEDRLKLDKVLLLNKLSRFEVEKLSSPHLSETELEKNIRERGINYEALIESHQINKTFQERVYSAFKQFGIDVRKVNRFNCSDGDIEWCDAVVPVGGDGTFLNAARYILNNGKPVIGFNSDPFRSEGFLCLPKKYSDDIPSAIRKLLEGKFKWMLRTRIRVNFNRNDNCIPTELHDIKSKTFIFNNIRKKEKSVSGSQANDVKSKLPILALNEVFMSEIFAAKVSFFEMELNNSNKNVKIKSSGLCVCTGTGSTSWNLSLNRLSRQDIHDILKLYIMQTKGEINDNFDHLVHSVTKSFNEKFIFGPETPILGYTIRDLISLGVWPNPKGLIQPRGFAKTIKVKSKCLDAGIIIDGGISFSFNEGTTTCLEIHPQDALRTVILHD